MFNSVINTGSSGLHFSAPQPARYEMMAIVATSSTLPRSLPWQIQWGKLVNRHAIGAAHLVNSIKSIAVIRSLWHFVFTFAFGAQDS
eukprot:1183079-Amphidinium_carterae.1